MKPGTKVKIVQVPSSYRDTLTHNQKGVFERLSDNTPGANLHLVRMDTGGVYGLFPHEILPLTSEESSGI